MRVIEKDRGMLLAQELDIPFLETSAKLDLNVDTAFELLTKMIMEENTKKVELDLNPRASDSVILNGHGESEKKQSCCQKSE